MQCIKNYTILSKKNLSNYTHFFILLKKRKHLRGVLQLRYLAYYIY